MFLDGTARHHPMGIVPASDNGARVVIVKPDGVEPRRIDFASAGENRLVQDFRVVVTDVETARVELHQQSFGRHDPSLRGRFSGSAEERDEQAELAMSAMFGAISGGVQVEFTDLEDLGIPAEARFDFAPDRLARPNGRGYELPKAFSPLQLLRGIASESERTTDLLQSTPWSIETSIDYVLPPGHELSALSPPLRIEGDDAKYSWQAEATETGVRIHERFELKTHRIPPDRYGPFRELCRQVDVVQESYLQVEVKP